MDGEESSLASSSNIMDSPVFKSRAMKNPSGKSMNKIKKFAGKIISFVTLKSTNEKSLSHAKRYWLKDSINVSKNLNKTYF